MAVAPAGASHAVDRVAKILALFRERNSWGISEMAASLEEHKSVVYRVVRGLTTHGFLEQEAGTRKYRLGLQFLEYGDLVASRLELRELCAPSLMELLTATGETALLSVIRAGWCVCVDKVETPERVKVVYELGARNPVHAAAAALAILAFQPETEVDRMVGLGPYPVFAQNTPSGRAELEHRLDEVRRQGYAVSSGDLDPWVLAIAAPVVDWSGKAIASLCVAGPRERLWPNREHIIEQVCLQGQAVSKQLSERWGREGHIRPSKGVMAPL